MRIPVTISNDSGKPLYHQIKEQLRAMILSGNLPEGILLPSIREFAADLSCSVITIRRVYQDLEQEGLLYTRQGTGTFVAKVGYVQRERFRNAAVYEAFRNAVETGRQVNCTDEEMREILNSLLEETDLIDE
ncbi:GntR family transcriptional regulator [Paenibacillus sp. J2TS4]|uniref:GntR family transcriptional regulator n=1 Tax=Paenibacillus sp. J2TS4 TaxID=2807194 RepID=UPI001AFF6E1D|nr:GntR family transcriptional regulator [Paenibacillus sp. J2TS4]GIP34823.1 GntR family transcriptional regulator [Paenibacillus sp. J2TS4]